MEMAIESSRLEPLLFSDFGGFVVHNVWTWVALLSAALSFFGLRLLPPASSPSSPTTTTTASSNHPFVTKSDDQSTAETMFSSTPDDHTISSDSTATTIVCTTTTKTVIDGCRKITEAYYRDEEHDDDDEVEVEIEDEVDGCGVLGGDDDVVMKWQCKQIKNRIVTDRSDRQEQSQCGELEYEVVMMRMREMGWYKFQDLSVLDGSVVRLWEGGLMGGVW